MIWVEQNADEKQLVARRFDVVGTGQLFEPFQGERLTYLGTVLINGGELVRHLYERET